MRAEYESYARNAILQLRRVREGDQLEQDHMRNRQMVVHWLIANTDAIEVRRRDGRTYNVVTDAEAFRAGVATLLAEVQRIKSPGRLRLGPSALRGARHPVRSGAARRGAGAGGGGRPAVLHGFVMPKLDAVTGPDGEITDVVISYPRDFTQQMLEYSGRR